MLDSLETYLARRTGRANWPTTHATLEEHLNIPQGCLTDMVPNTETDDIFSYKVDGEVYVADVEEIVGRKNIMGSTGNKVLIQYNPRRPKQYYYAPACQLASRVVVATVLLGVALAIALSIHLHG